VNLKPNQNICHLKHCTLSKVTSSTIDFSYKDTDYSICFEDENGRFEKNTGFFITRQDGNPVDINLLSWLMLFFGEDTINPYAEPDTRFNFNRGDFDVDKNVFLSFVACVEKYPRSSHPKWKQDLIEKALSYYMCAVRTGLSLMPLNIGFFAMSIECLGNAYYGKRDRYFTLGQEKFVNIIKTRLKRYKKNVKFKDDVRKFEKYIHKELEVLHLLRNAYYGHSLLHLHDDKVNLINTLKEWYIQNGHSKTFAKVTFNFKHLDKIIAVESLSLYKVGLKLNRLLFFYFLGFARQIPFASHDFRTIGKKLEQHVIKVKPRTA